MLRSYSLLLFPHRTRPSPFKTLRTMIFELPSRRTRFEKAVMYLDALGCRKVTHTKRTLLDHLIATHDLLCSWDAVEPLCLGGLFHSIYGTDGFQTSAVGDFEQDRIRTIIGAEAESIVWRFGMMTHASFWAALATLGALKPPPSTLILVDRLNGKRLDCTSAEFIALINVTLANALDQARYVPERYGSEKRALLYPLLAHALPKARDAFELQFAQSSP